MFRIILPVFVLGPFMLLKDGARIVSDIMETSADHLKITFIRPAAKFINDTLVFGD